MMSYVLILASFSRFVLTWLSCGALAAEVAATSNATKAGGGGTFAVSDGDGVTNGVDVQENDSCSAQLVNLRVRR